MNRKALLLSTAAAAGAGLAFYAMRDSMDLEGKVVLITGGSHGLGLALARGFAGKGARLALCARTIADLEAAEADLTQAGAEVVVIPCDVADRRQVEHLIQATLDHYGHIDVLVNNAGEIRVGPVDTMTIEDFEDAMNVMFWGPVYTTLAVLPHLRKRRASRIVNITSIGGKVSIPHLLPYSCAKFAAAAFSEGMRSELQGTRIKVVTVAPGLMRTGSYLNAIFKGAEEGEAGWFSVGASMPGLAISAESAAEQIISATRTGRAERILSAPANLLSQFHGLFPGVTADLLGLVGRLLPHGSRDTETGAQSATLQKGWIYLLTTLGRKAAQQFLQPSARAHAAGS